VGLEQGDALFGVVPRLNTPQFGILLRQHNRLNAHFGENSQNILSSFGHQLIGEEIAIANDDCQFVFCH